MRIIISNIKNEVRNQSISLGHSFNLFYGFKPAYLQQRDRILEIQLGLLVLEVCYPEIFSGPIWPPLWKISGGTTGRITSCITKLALQYSCVENWNGIFFFFLRENNRKGDIHSQKLGGSPSTLYSSSCNTCINILVPFKSSFETFKMCYQALMRMCVFSSLMLGNMEIRWGGKKVIPTIYRLG